MKEWQIYALKDPRDGRIRYIGQTSMSLRRRMQAHLLRAPIERTHKGVWLRNLLAAGLKPVYEVLGTGYGEWAEAERRWIREGRERGWALTNGTAVGEGLRGLSDEGRARLSAARRARITKSETRAKMSEARKNQRLSASHLQAIRAGHRGRALSPEARAKAIASLGRWATKGHQQPSETAWAQTPGGRAHLRAISKLSHTLNAARTNGGAR